MRADSVAVEICRDMHGGEAAVLPDRETQGLPVSVPATTHPDTPSETERPGPSNPEGQDSDRLN